MPSKFIQHEIEVESGIPLPEKRGWSNACEKLKKAKVGDSVFFQTRNLALHFLQSVHRHTVMTVTMRKIDGEGYRVWRIK
jgi:hypothetical protein